MLLSSLAPNRIKRDYILFYNVGFYKRDLAFNPVADFARDYIFVERPLRRGGGGRNTKDAFILFLAQRNY